MSAPSTETHRTGVGPLSVISDPALRYSRVDWPGDEPHAEKNVVDVAVLDMNHGWPNLGHSSIVETLLTLGRLERLTRGDDAPEFRVISYDVRRSAAMPKSISRFPLIVGTGGPGAIDPKLNDGVSVGSQGILEDPSWETPLWRLFDKIIRDRRVAFLGVCHSFGILSRWSGAAEAVLRNESKGKSAGVVTNLLAESTKDHPWFGGFWRDSNGPEIEVLDSRLFDLMPTGRGQADLLAFEGPSHKPQSERAVTMMELARDDEGVLPRVWAVNHHPEIGDRGLQRDRLARLELRGEVSEEWVVERRAALEAWNASAATERHLQTTAAYTFERPLRKYISRAFDERLRSSPPG